jgi:DNA invertase Pin-like site-specific DNA recombinase
MTTSPLEMPPSPKIKPWHLDRAAVVYVRQSTPQQVTDHQESTARQYALADRAARLGWPRSQVHVIDDDLGKSGQSIEGRPGFQRLLAEVALDHVGLILGLEMSRLARSCKDWHQLLELCARFRVLLADADGVYDPNEYADRLMLGLTGMMSEAELHVLKGRMHQGKLHKARRGELVVSVPLGYLKHPSGQVTLDPDEQVQHIVRMIFDLFDQKGTVHGVLRAFIAQGIQLPMRSQARINRGQLEWRPPCRETIRQILLHPTYAGAYRYGHRPTDARRQKPGFPKSGRGSGLAAEACQVFLKDRFPPYITWERFEANQERLAANRSRAESAGAVRDGVALLAGVVGCGRCGRRMYVRYSRRGQRPTYVCSWQRSDYGLPLCQSASAELIEAWVADQILAALEPAALAASLTAAGEVEERRRQQTQLWQQRLERARYEADRAARQYQACEPENRLVTRTLERQWDEALHKVGQLEGDFERFTRSCPRLLGESDREQIRRLAQEVPALWHAPTTTSADRRQIARLLLERVVLTVDAAGDRVGVRVEWAGGVVREQTIAKAVRGYKDQRDWPRLSARLTALYQAGWTPAEIAAALEKEGFRPPKRAAQFMAGMVRRLLDQLGLRPRVSRVTGSSELLGTGEWWLSDLADRLGLSPHTLHGWRRKGWLHIRQVGGRGGPWAVWVNDAELARLSELKSCPRLWSNRERLAELRSPTPRQ